MDIKTLFVGSLFFDKNITNLSEIYKEGIKKVKKNLGQADGGHIF